MVNVDGPGEGRVNVYIPRSLYEVTLAMVCEEILSKGKLVIAKRPSTISLAFQIFISILFELTKYVRLPNRLKCGYKVVLVGPVQIGLYRQRICGVGRQ